MWKLLCLAFITVTALAAQAQDDSAAPSKKIIIYGDEDGYFDSHRHDTTDEVEVLTKDKIEKANSTSLNEAIDRVPGVDSQDYCVNCGAKRISINGLRGDHTSVLVDGIPLYSAVSSVYGFDAIATQSVQEIEVRRGTGAALTNPEAIGGSINIITLMPRETGTKASYSYGTFKSQNAELLHNYVTPGYKLSVGGEFNRQEPWDTDGNGMAESPWKSRYSFFLKQTINLSDSVQWATRASYANLEIIGGNLSHMRLEHPIPFQASDSDFVDGDVRKPFIGDISEITEDVRVERSEATSKVIAHLDAENSLEWNLAEAIYKQDSFYMHAYDYHTKDLTFYTDLKWRHQLRDNQIFLLGTSFRQESLRSESEVMYDTNLVPKDNFDYNAYSAFAQHEWLFSQGWELTSALRFEHLRSDWSYLGTIDKDVIAPRLLLKWDATEHLTHQFGYGYGYRMPLTSIESAHGAYDGFIVDIKDLEKAHSLVYTASYNTPTYYVTPGVHYTHLEGMSYPLEPAVPHSMPLRFINDTESYDIFVYDLLTGVRPVPEWLLEVDYEFYTYPDGYKEKLPTAAIERRLNVRSEVELQGYTFIVSGMWVGSRDLSKYNMYPNHYNVSQGLLGVQDQKWQNSPDYWRWDASLTKRFHDVEFMAGVENIFDYTQASAGDTPAMWHLHGNHTHLDNRHVWGPNRGREAYLKVTYYF